MLMKQEGNEHQKIIDQLQELPNIKDDMEKEVLYNHISSNLTSEPDLNKRKNSKFLPIFATTTIALIFITSFLFTTDMLPLEQSSEIATNQEMIVNRADEANELARTNKNQENYTEYSESGEMHRVESNEQSKSFVIANTDNSPLTIVYGAMTDEQQQYVIPLSFIMEENTDVNKSYNDMEQFIDDENWGINEYMLRDASFQLKESEVLIDLESDFSLDEGTTHMFERFLSTMFTPYGIRKAVFRTDKNGNGIELEPYGNIKELSLQEEENVYYKLYQNQFLVPITNSDNVSISGAISEMKMKEEGFPIVQTIPSGIELDVLTEDEQLTLTFEDNTSLDNNQQGIIMVEALLMTAKSYGFQTVQFHNSPVNQIGNYNLSTPINVPEAVNPVDLRN